MDTEEGTLRDGLYIKSKPSPYSPQQLARYITRIGYTPIIANGLFAANLDNLERLIRLHLLAFPFENTAMHYTLERTVNLEPQSLYHRFMDELKGADCFGQNSFFLYILRGLGYRAYNVVGRVNVYKVLEPTEYPPQDHLLMLVQPIPDSNVTYLVDVGYCTGPIRPILLADSDKSVVLGTTDTERYRIKRRADPRSSVGERPKTTLAHRTHFRFRNPWMFQQHRPFGLGFRDSTCVWPHARHLDRAMDSYVHVFGSRILRKRHL
ncbi:hypothetical protein M378DRAFT_163863 [Amanita muscaria Koide BX008]|uniref:Arylamine N-acetyltransferase n=1 Tax=Amanita muscaria (strain Koide BX008) TaxID=946122 RepID=A0A0C2X5A9_AMAMK|nr:hypothetical protein M378DRAFT_163863 [Amanita muscaria Koide BX008]